MFQEMYESEHLVDVTIGCDRNFLKAHKLVLAACSPYFQQLFMANPCKHPIVILKDVRFQDLKSLVEFMYRGEVTVNHDQLPSLLKTAETLQIKQLAEMMTRSASYDAPVQSFQRKKRKRPKVKRLSGGNGPVSQDGVSEDDDLDMSSPQKMLLIHGNNGQQLVATTGPDGQQILTETQDGGDGTATRILELSMAEVVGASQGTSEQETVTSELIEEEEQQEEEEEEEVIDASVVDASAIMGLFASGHGEDNSIMLIRKKQSFVWEYFTETGKGSVKCRKCGKLLSYKDTSGSTSNMIKHLKTVHTIERTLKPMLQE